MRKLLWVGDAACPSGFARATHETLEVLRRTWDVTVLGINYRGDPHEYPYPIYAAAPGGDGFGVGRLVWMCDAVKPDMVVLQNDPWNIPSYIRQLRKFPEYKDIPVVASLAVDGLNCRGDMLNDLAGAIFWTKFGKKQARLGGYFGPAEVVPLGVDVGVYTPGDREDARKRRGLPEDLQSAFLFGNVNRNQPRKRLDLTIRYFAEWYKNAGFPKDAYLYLHVGPTGDSSYDLTQLARYYGVLPRLILMEPAVFYGIGEEEMMDTYRGLNVQISTTQGEGFGLTTFEGMACGIPQIVPKWSALEELTKDAAVQVQCSSTHATPGFINSIGGVPDEDEFVDAMSALYEDGEYRDRLSAAGLQKVHQPEYRWENVGEAFAKVLEPLAL